MKSCAAVQPHCWIGAVDYGSGRLCPYMERIGASRAMVSLLSRPLNSFARRILFCRQLTSSAKSWAVYYQRLRSGYVADGHLISELVSLGVSRLSAVAVIATTMSLSGGFWKRTPFLLPRSQE